MNQLAAMRMFTKVAESLNFSIAAKQLGVSSAVITRSISTLESHLNIRLFNRTTRHVSLTNAGQAYLEGCAELLNQLEMLETNISSATRESVGSLKIAAPESFAASDLSELLAAYHVIEPRVNFEVTVFDNSHELVANQYDVWFTAERRLRNSSSVCRALTQFRDVIVATPSYLDGRGVPRVPEDLTSHNILTASDGTNRYWEFGDAHGTHRITMRPTFNSPNLLAVKRATLAALGIARLPKPLVRAELRAGTLRRLLEGFDLEDDERTLWLLYSKNRYMTKGVRRFVDFAAARYREPEEPGGSKHHS